jgi:UDP-N-acetylmuramyl tripeptide synthase
VPGRFEPVEAGQEFAVLVDYAHTPDSLENVLLAGRELAEGRGGRVLCVFGCGGDRDRGKRPLMGAIAVRLADRTFVTSDNPRSEPPERIIAEILAGVGPHAPDALESDVDRRRAIGRAVEAAEAATWSSSRARATSRARSSPTGARSPSTTWRWPARPCARCAPRTMRGWNAQRVAEAAGARLVRDGAPGGPARAVIDSRGVGAGDLFVGLRGDRADGGSFGAGALEAGAWGVLVGAGWV